MAATMLAGAAGIGPAIPAARAARPAMRQAAPAEFGPPPGNTVLPLPMPCADRPGDIVGLLIEGTGSPPGTVMVFGQAFRAGDLPRGAALHARMADSGRVLRTQADVTTRHADGSARFAVVSIELAAALPPRDRLGLVLFAGQGAAGGAALDPAAALAGRQAMVEVAPPGGGAPWRFDLLATRPTAAGAGPRNGLGGGGRPWQWGPLALQWRVAAAVPPAAVGGATSMRLVADIAVHSDGTLWVDAWLRNDIAMREGGGHARYQARVFIDGVEALAFAPPQAHWQYTGIGRQLVARPGGRPAGGQPVLRPNALYLAETGAVPPYDLTIGVDPRMLQSMAQLRGAPAWNEPFNERGITRYMPMTGGRADIGPMTGYAATWLITGEPLAAQFCIGQAEAAGGIPWHVWDMEGGADRRGGWLNVRRWPRLWTDARGGRPPGGLLQQIGAESGWAPDTAHQPDIAYFPYLMTGRRALFDEFAAQGMWDIATMWPTLRTPPGWEGRPGADMIVVNRGQVRGAAWSLRQLDELAWLIPDDDPDAAYSREAATGNFAWLRSRIPAFTASQGEVHGWLPGDYGTRGALPPWQQDYFASTVAAAARRGNADARAFLAFMANFLVGRFQAEDRGFAFNDGAAYLIAISPDANGDPQPFRRWAEIGAAQRARNFSNGTDWAHSRGDYVLLALQSLAQVIDVLDLPAAREAYARLLAAGAPMGRPATMASWPSLAIVPRGMQFFPARLRACTPAAPARG